MSKTVIITGSSTGIGKATAKLFQEKGWNVIATMRSPEKEEELNKLDNVLVTRLDVEDLSSIEEAIKEGIEKFGKIDVLVNNAGYGLMGTFESIDRESIQRQFNVNVFGLFDVTKAILPHMRANKSGMIINISSIAGKMTFPAVSPYHSSKFAVEGFSESLTYELEPLGIGVKIVEPGAIHTDFSSRSLDFKHDDKLAEEYNNVIAKVQAMFGSMTPETIGSAEMVADVIFTAATDGKNQLRYLAGKDAEEFIGARKSMSDEDFMAMMKKNMGL